MLADIEPLQCWLACSFPEPLQSRLPRAAPSQVGAGPPTIEMQQRASRQATVAIHLALWCCCQISHAPKSAAVTMLLPHLPRAKSRKQLVCNYSLELPKHNRRPKILHATCTLLHVQTMKASLEPVLLGPGNARNVVEPGCFLVELCVGNSLLHLLVDTKPIREPDNELGSASREFPQSWSHLRGITCS